VVWVALKNAGILTMLNYLKVESSTKIHCQRIIEVNGNLFLPVTFISMVLLKERSLPMNEIKIPKECQGKDNEECPLLHWNCYTPHCNALGKILKIDNDTSSPIKECTLTTLCDKQELLNKVIKILRKNIMTYGTLNKAIHIEAIQEISKLKEHDNDKQ
jgi:hypothetical protein